MSVSGGRNNTNGVYSHSLKPAELDKMIRTADALPLRRDFVTLLNYVRDSRVVGTQSTGNMPLKSVRELTARFVNPPVLDTQIGDHVYRLRSESDVWELYFLHILADVGDLLVAPKGKQWKLKRMGTNFLNLNALQQVVYLLNVWWYQVNWLVAYPFAGMGESLPIRFNMITLSQLHALPVSKGISFEPFADGLIREANLKWHAESQDMSARLLRGSIERMVVKVLEKFGVLKTEHIEKQMGRATTQELVSFEITGFGKKVLESIKMIGT